MRRVSAVRAGGVSTGWQAVKIMRSRSSAMTGCSAPGSSNTGCSSSGVCRPSSSSLRAKFASRRIRSTARCFAVNMSQPPGFGGTPARGHCSSAATWASCASSSAVAISPTSRVSPATSRGHSIRHAASIARRARSGLAAADGSGTVDRSDTADGSGTIDGSDTASGSGIADGSGVAAAEGSGTVEADRSDGAAQFWPSRGRISSSSSHSGPCTFRNRRDHSTASSVVRVCSRQ